MNSRIRKNIGAIRKAPHFALKKVNLDEVKRVVSPIPYASTIEQTEEVKKYFSTLLENIDKKDDNGSPFICDISKPIVLNDLADSKKIEVMKIYHDKNIEKIKDEHFDIITVIPFRGRTMHLYKTLESLSDSAKNTSAKIGFLVVENSNKPIANDVVDIFDSTYYRWLDSKGKMFNKCLCHNVGAYISSSDILHFHDCDIVVPTDFYPEIIKSLERNQAVQCFTRRRVNYMVEDATKDILSGGDINKILKNYLSFSTGGDGAPGGSIALKRNLFEMVGGFDPHFFWGYSIEDAFFWKKISGITHIFSLDNPPIELFHLWHPPSWGKNPLEHFERNIYKKSEQNSEVTKYIEKAVGIYKEILSKIVID